LRNSRSRPEVTGAQIRTRHLLEYAAFAGVVRLFRRLPSSASYALASALGLAWYALDAKHRRIALSNLRIAFGKEKSSQQIERLSRASFQNACLNFAEFCQLMAIEPATVRSMVETKGYDNFLRARAKNRGVLIFTAHLGNWELMALFQSARDGPINVLGRPLDNRLLNETLDKVRTRFGNRVITKQRAGREMMRLLRDSEVIGVLMDQNTIANEGVFVDFFGKSACTTPIVALMAQRLDVPVLPAFAYRTGPGRHVVVVGEEVELQETGDRQRDLTVNTAKLTKIIESHIRQYPHQWLWMHNRWKTRPEGAVARRKGARARSAVVQSVGVPGTGGAAPLR